MLPAQTFSTIDQLLTYINTYIIPNGHFKINGQENNNALNAAVNFIPAYAINAGGGDLHITGGDFTITKPVTVFYQVTPTSVSWADNVQKEFYIVNATPNTMNLATSYLDQYGVTKTTIAPGFSVHIAKMTNNTWASIGNIGGPQGPKGADGSSSGTTEQSNVFS